MILSKKQKEEILEAFKMVDVKKMDIETPNPRLVKWFRFGSFNGMMVASEIIKNWPEKKPVKVKVKIS
jgi:hypothetical protein